VEWTCEVVEGELLKKQILIYARVPVARDPDVGRARQRVSRKVARDQVY
jgi:hypothetical protein